MKCKAACEPIFNVSNKPGEYKVVFKSACNVPSKPVKSKAFCKTLRVPNFIKPERLADVHKPKIPVNFIKIVPTINSDNSVNSKIVDLVNSSKPVRPVGSSKPVRPVDVRSVNSNQLLRLFNFSKSVRPIDCQKHIRPFNTNTPV